MSTAHGFTLISEEKVDEINSITRLYKHEKSGAELLSIINDDENKTFGITFRTPVTSSSGVPHIMEHAVLGGSRKFPVKEPFIELVKGSLNTFLNAFTYPDMTCYPVASTNLQDFYNLVDVYLDAVFYPLITPHHLDQEGWHYELEQPDQPLKYKGIVFNEMKGAYSSPDSILFKYSRESLFSPDHPYGVDSGGDPAVIPDLTYDQFKGFHDIYYHPSNARIYFYGDDNPEERLIMLDRYLRDFDDRSVPSEVPLFPLRDEFQRHTIPYAVDEPGEESPKYYLTLNWLLPEITDRQTAMGLSILSHILSGTAGSPLQRTLIESELGEDTIGGGFSTYMRQPLFMSGMKGVEKENLPQVEKLILDTLTQLANEGIDPAAVEASVNTVEFSLREANTGSFPRGLVYMLNALSFWLHEGNPLDGLRYEEPLAAIKEAVAAGSYFESLIKTFVLDNHHRTSVTLEPDPQLNQQKLDDEEARLAEIKAGLTDDELESIIANSAALKRRQETPDDPADLAKLPSLTLDDLDKDVKELPIVVENEHGLEIIHHDLFTNGIVYFRLGFDLKVLPQDLLPFLPLFSYALTDIGTETEDYVKLTQRIGRSTGGINASRVVTDKFKTREALSYLTMRGKATLDQAPEMLAIMRDILLTVKLDNQARFRQMVLEEKAGEEARLIPSGHGIVLGRLRGMFTKAGWINQQMGGIDYLFFLRRLVDEVENSWPTVLKKLETIRKLLVNRQNMYVDTTLDQDNYRIFRPQIDGFLNQLPSFKPEKNSWQFAFQPQNEGLTMPAQVNYVAKGIDLKAHGFETHGSINVISNMIQTGYLWEQVRMKGGAYGGFMSYNSNSGLLAFCSYRDPNLLETVAVYDQAAGVIKNTTWTQDAITKAIIGVIGSLDGYQLPEAKGKTALMRHLHGITTADRQRIRNEVLRTGPDDFYRFVDVAQTVRDKGTVVVLGAPDRVQQASEAVKMSLTKVK